MPRGSDRNVEEIPRTRGFGGGFGDVRYSRRLCVQMRVNTL